MARDLAALRQTVEQLKERQEQLVRDNENLTSQFAASREEMARNKGIVDQIKATQIQMARESQTLTEQVNASQEQLARVIGSASEPKAMPEAPKMMSEAPTMIPEEPKVMPEIPLPRPRQAATVGQAQKPTPTPARQAKKPQPLLAWPWSVDRQEWFASRAPPFDLLAGMVTLRASTVVTEPDLLLQLLIVALDAPARLARSTSRSKLTFSGSVASQYLVRSASPSGHSINSHSGDSLSGISLLYPTRTRTRAKREDSWSAEPSRHVTVRQACFGRPSAAFLAETNSCSSRRPVLFIGFSIRRRPLPGDHIKMLGTMPTT